MAVHRAHGGMLTQGSGDREPIKQSLVDLVRILLITGNGHPVDQGFRFQGHLTDEEVLGDCVQWFCHLLLDFWYVDLSFGEEMLDIKEATLILQNVP